MKSFFVSLRSRAAALRREDPLRFRFLVGAGIVALVIAVILLSVDAPWEGNTGKHVAAGKKIRVTEHAHIGSWWAAVTNLGILLALIFTSRWWWPWALVTDGPETSPDSKGRNRSWVRLFTWLGLAVALFVALWIRVPQMNRYLMFDEQDNLRRSIYGYAEIDQKSGEPVFVDASWKHAFFENRLANNPVLMSVASKASLTVWQKVSGKGKLWFSRPALRLPSLLGGVLSIVVFWWFVNLLGMPFGAVVTACFLALHPFHIDYSIQARGYGMMFFFIGTACCSALLAMRTGRWLWFAGLGLSLAAVLGCYSGATYFVMAFGGALAVWLGWCGFVRKERRSRALFTRLLVTGLIAGGLYLQLIAPSIPQMRVWLVESFARSELGAPWLANAYTLYATGAWFTPAWDAMPPENRPHIFKFLYDAIFTVDVSYAILVLGLIPLFTAIGFVRIWRRGGGAARAILLAGCIAPVAAYCIHEFITHLWLHGWYILYFLPFLAVMIGCGVAGFTLWIGRRIPVAGPALAVVMAAVFLAYFWYEARPGKLGRRALQAFSHDDHTGKDYTVLARGPYNWVIYEEGRMIRQPLSVEIPEEFPYDEDAIEIIVKP